MAIADLLAASTSHRRVKGHYTKRLSLDSGDMLLLYTDGLAESCNSAGEEYGFHRIKRVARQHLRTTPSKLISECLSDNRNFQSGANRSTT